MDERRQTRTAALNLTHPSLLPESIVSLPKAELHVHLEGSMQPRTVVAVAAHHGAAVTEKEVRERYAFQNFTQFLEAFKWVTAFLREPQDYALIAAHLAEQLLSQNVAYAEVTISVGVMLLRRQRPEANFAAIQRAIEPFASRGLAMNWIFDAVRQFGADSAMRVVEAAKQCATKTIVAFGTGGDEMSVPTKELRAVYDRAADLGLHRLIHAGEVGGPDKIREGVELLGAERIGHGIATISDPTLMDLLADRRIPLEVCPQSNVRTGALAIQLGNKGARIEDHPLPALFRHGIPVVLSTDDPAMFHTTLLEEYGHTHRMGLNEKDLLRLVQMSFDYAFARQNTTTAV